MRPCLTVSCEIRMKEYNFIRVEVKDLNLSLHPFSGMFFCMCVRVFAQTLCLMGMTAVQEEEQSSAGSTVD